MTTADEKYDATYQQGIAHVLKYGDLSCSGLQKRLRIGYSLAMNLKVRMEKNGVSANFNKFDAPDSATIKIIEVESKNSLRIQTWTGAVSSSHKITRFKDHENLSLHTRLTDELRTAHMVFIVARRLADTRLEIVSDITRITKEYGIPSIVVFNEKSSVSKVVLEQIPSDKIQHMFPDADAIFPISNARQDEGLDVDDISDDHISHEITQIISMVSQQRSITIDFADFCRTMLGFRKNVSPTIRAASGQSHGVGRGTLAVKHALQDNLFHTHLLHSEGVILSITANPTYLYSRELKEINSAIQNYVKDSCTCLFSVFYDPNLPPDVIIVDIFASRYQ